MTILIEGSIQDVVSTCREVDILPKQFFFKNFDDFVCSPLGLYSDFQFASGKVRSPQMTIGLFLGMFHWSNWKSYIVYRYELDMGGL